MTTRNLTVMFTDLTGFTQATSEMSRDQIDRYLSAHDRLVRPIILSRQGRVIKTIGDSFLAAFDSPTDAVLAGVQIQDAVDEYNRLVKPEEKMEIRVSINVGEVTEKDGDIYGDAVNVASRLLSVAEKNGVYFTEAVYLVMNKKEVPTAEVGYRQFKGVPEKIKVYRVLRELPSRGGAPPPETPPPIVPKEEAPRPGKRVAVLPMLMIILFASAGIFAIVALVLQETGKKKPVAAVSTSPRPVASARSSSAPKPRRVAAAAKGPAPKPRVVSSPRPRLAASPLPRQAPRASQSPAAMPRPVRAAAKKPARAQTKRARVRRVAAVSGEARVYISSTPPRAAVYVDDRFMGHTDIGFPLPAGVRHIRLSKPGYSDKIFELNLKPGEVLNEKFSLDKRE